MRILQKKQKITQLLDVWLPHVETRDIQNKLINSQLELTFLEHLENVTQFINELQMIPNKWYITINTDITISMSTSTNKINQMPQENYINISYSKNWEDWRVQCTHRKLRNWNATHHDQYNTSIGNHVAIHFETVENTDKTNCWI